MLGSSMVQAKRLAASAVLLGTLLLLITAAQASPLALEALTDRERQQDVSSEEKSEQSSARSAGAFVAWMLTTQREMHRTMSQGMRELRQDNSLANGAWIVLVSFLYGIFHAAGPGHGKAIVTTYLLTHRTELRRGLALSFAASILQAVTAIALVAGLVNIAGWLSRDAMGQVENVELVSFGLVALLGALLCVRALRRFVAHRGETPSFHPAPGPFPATGPIRLAPNGGEGPSLVPHTHASDCGCGHAHHLEPSAVASDRGWWPVLGAVAAVGSRPCTGAVLLLIAANILGLWMIGLAAVFAMALGTAITVSILAVLAVKARALAARIAYRKGSHHWSLAADAVSFIGGLVILLAGLSLFAAAMTSGSAAIYQL